MKLYIMVPVYNAADTIASFLEGMRCYIFARKISLELIIIDDGSTDGTLKAIDENKSGLSLTLLSHVRRRGLGSALETGFFHMFGNLKESDTVIIIAPGLSPDPDTVTMILREMEWGNEIVVVSRYKKGSAPSGACVVKQMAGRTVNMLYRVLYALPGVKDYTSGFMGIRGTVFKRYYKEHRALPITRKHYAVHAAFLKNIARYANSISEVPLRPDRRDDQVSGSHEPRRERR